MRGLPRNRRVAPATADPLVALLEEPLDWRFRCFPDTHPPATARTLRHRGWNVLKGDLMLPAPVLKERALKQNIQLMAAYCHQRGLSFAPHAKTTMAPQIVRQQLDAGAWAITVATASQARVMRHFGVARILMANQLVDLPSLRWAANELRLDNSFEFYCLIDSERGVDLMEAELRKHHPSQPLNVLVELGYRDGRAGCRTQEEVLQVAAAARASSYLRLVGVEGFEGFIDAGSPSATKRAITDFLQELHELTVTLAEAGLFETQEVLVSAGGSAHFDSVAEIIGSTQLSGLEVRVVLRSGCYVSHDSGFYERISPLAARADPSLPLHERLQPAFEVWGTVLSQPHPRLAIVGFGKRDLAYDFELPRPRSVFRNDEVIPLSPKTSVQSLDDQHAYLALGDDDILQVGELVGCGISHPCAAFDKWRVIPVVDDLYNVVDAVWVFI